MKSLISDVMTCHKLERMLSGKKEEERPLARDRGGGRRRIAVSACEVKERCVASVVKNTVEVCKDVRAKRLREPDNSHLSDENLSQLARFTDGIDLEPYKHFFHYVPRLVNIVTVNLRPNQHSRACACTCFTWSCLAWCVCFHTCVCGGDSQLAEAFPMPGSGVTLPLNLSRIASRCTSAYYAPRRFAVRVR